MGLWKQQATLELVNGWSPNTMIAMLGIRITDIGDDYLRGTMPVDERTHQPYGLLHGGASVTLAETLGSAADQLLPDLRHLIGNRVIHSGCKSTLHNNVRSYDSRRRA